MQADITLTKRPAAGELLRAWRARRRLSQMELGLTAGVSARHLSYVETGRAHASSELLMALAEVLQLPLRERNALLLAAGYAPRYAQTPLDAPDLRAMREAITRVLDAHDPYPGLAVDRHWNLVLANAAARRLVARLPASLAQPQPNVFRLGLHPQGLAAFTTNFDSWGRYLLTQLQGLVDESADEMLAALLAEVRAYPNVQALLMRPAPAAPADQLIVPCELALHGQAIALFTTLARFGTPRDVTLAELTVELFYPSDAASAAALRALAGGAP